MREVLLYEPRMSSFSFRLATEFDLELIANLVNVAYRGDSGRVGWTTESDLLGGQRTDTESLKEILTVNDGIEQCILVLEEHDKILGCVYLKKNNERAYLGMLTVNPQIQSRGLGKQILTEAEHFVKENWRNSAVSLWR